MTLTYDEYVELIKKSEAEAIAAPAQYKRKLAWFSRLGTLYILGLFIVSTLAIWGIAELSMEYGGKAAAAKVILAIAVFLWVLITSLRVKFPPPEGRRITAQEFPQLFKTIYELEKKLQTTKIDEVILTPEVNASVVQTPRFGLIGGHKNTMTIGFELMCLLTEDEAKAVIAHEMGHLSGNHSKFAGRIYTSRIRLNRILQKLEEKESLGAFIVTKFFDWFVPRFDAYSFALARQNEYEADAMSADLTSADISARALVKVYAASDYINTSFWQNVTQESDKRAEPQQLPYSALLARLASPAPDPKLIDTLIEHNMRRETGYEDTHPCLSDRVKALEPIATQWQNLISPIGDSAAAAWLGDDLQETAAYFDAKWWRHNKDKWSAHFTEAEAMRAKLKAYQDMDYNDMDEQDRLYYAYYTERENGIDAALPLYEQLKAYHPEQHDGDYALGRIYSQKDDEKCLEHLKAIPDTHSAYFEAVNLMEEYLARHGRDEEQKKIAAAADAVWTDHQRIQQAYSTIDAKTPLSEPQNLTDGMKKTIIERLEKTGCVKSAWIAERLPEGDDVLKAPMFIITFESSKKKLQKLMGMDQGYGEEDIVIKAIEDGMSWPEPADIFVKVDVMMVGSNLCKTVKQTGTKII